MERRKQTGERFYGACRKKISIIVPWLETSGKLLLFLLLSSSSFSQDIQYARKILDTLTAPGMHGRGYVNNGCGIAADFLENEFKKLGLKPFKESYRQKFSMKVNTFPGKMSVTFGERSLLPGIDFIVHSGSGKISGTFEMIWFTKEMLMNPSAMNRFRSTDLSDKVIVVDKSALVDKADIQLFDSFILNPFKARGIIFTESKKFTWSVAPKAFSYAVLYVMSDALKAEKKITLNIENKSFSKFQAENVLGFVPGSQSPDTFLLFTAHYDHLGRMGSETYFPGANDNSSGIAMLLNLAKHFSEKPHRYSVAFIAFAGEEAGLLGSEYYVKHPFFPLSKIKFLINMDLLGTGDDGMMAVNGAVFEDEFNQLSAINAEKRYLKEIQKRPKAANSDHYHFVEKGVRGFFFYTLGGIAAYHDVYDKAETLPLTEFDDIFRLIVDFVETSFP
jgi:hypothetical protein